MAFRVISNYKGTVIKNLFVCLVVVFKFQEGDSFMLFVNRVNQNKRANMDSPLPFQDAS